jgi:hypothetical protein
MKKAIPKELVDIIKTENSTPCNLDLVSSCEQKSFLFSINVLFLRIENLKGFPLINT